MLSLPRLLLARSPETEPPRLPVHTEPVRTGYRVGPDCRLLRIRSVTNWSGGFLMVSGEPDLLRGDSEHLLRQLPAECRAHGAAGVVVNWTQTGRHPAFFPRLEEALAREGTELWVPEALAAGTENATVLISSHLSGGTLAGRLEESVSRWGSRTALALECDPWLFPLPCPPGTERPLEETHLQRLLKRRRRVWFSESLCAQYMTCLLEGRLHLALFDNGSSIRRKLELAGHCGLSGALLAWEELAPFAETVFPAEEVFGV